MASEKNIHILEGEQAREHLDDATLIHLTNRVNNIELEDDIGLARHETARRIYDLLQDIGEAAKIDKAFWPIDHMKDLREKGDIAVAMDGEKAIGMSGFERRGIDPRSGRPVYEVRRIAVRKEYENRGIGTRLKQTIMQRVMAVDPKALILVETTNPTIVRQSLKMGFTQCSFHDGMLMKFGSEEAVEKHQESFKGSQFFVYDPSSGKAPPAERTSPAS